MQKTPIVVGAVLITMLFVVTGGLADDLVRSSKVTKTQIRGNAVQGITGVTFNRRTCMVLIFWSGGGGSYQSKEVDPKLLASWGFPREEVELCETALRQSVEASKAESDRKAKAVVEKQTQYAATLGSLGSAGAFKQALIDSGLRPIISGGGVRAYFNERRWQPLKAGNIANPTFKGELEVLKQVPVYVASAEMANGVNVHLTIVQSNVVKIIIGNNWGTISQRQESLLNARLPKKGADLVQSIRTLEEVLPEGASGALSKWVETMITEASTSDALTAYGKRNSSDYRVYFQRGTSFRGDSMSFDCVICTPKMAELHGGDFDR